MTGISLAILAAMALWAVACDPPTIPAPRVPRIVRAYFALGLALGGFALSVILPWLARRWRRLRAESGRRYGRDGRAP